MNCLLERSNVINLIITKLTGDSSAKDEPYLKGSISDYTKDLIMTFPVLCDNSLPPETASMLSRANERNIVTLLELLFSSVQLNGTDGVEILSKIHKNIKTTMSLDDYIDAVDSLAAKVSAAGGIRLENAEIRTVIKAMNEQLKTPQRSFPVNSFSERSLNGYTVFNMNGKTVVKESIDSDISNMDPKDVSDFVNRQKAQMNRNQMNRQSRVDQYEDSEQMRNAELYPIRQRNLINQSADYEINALSKQLLDTDVKKANEMTPTLMIVKFNEVDPTTSELRVQQKSFIAGVKARLISTDPSDIVERIVAKNRTKLSFVNLIRATTGEIKIVKDFLLCIDQAKIDAKNSVKKGESAKMWKVLENLAIKNNYNRIKRKGNDASCITTLIINQETVNILKKEYDFDLEKIANTKMIMDAYNLLGVIIADESISVAKFLYRGNDQFEQQAYSYLERESNDNSYKKVINLIGKMNGR